jgi:hypothetical protein
MREVFRKRIRRQGKGVNVAADVDAVVAINTGPGQRQHVSVQSEHSVRQPDPRPEDTSHESPPPDEKEEA